VTLDGGLVKIAAGPGSSPASGSPKQAVSPTAPEPAREADTAHFKKPPPAHKKEAVEAHGGDIDFSRSAATRTTAESTMQSAPESAMQSAQASAPHITSRPTDPVPVPAPTLEAALDTLDLACLDADGSPAAGYPFTVTLSSGPVITGTLNSAGTARLENLTPGTAAVRFGKTEPETRVIRNQIHTLLKDIIKAEQREAQAIEARLSKKGVLGKAVEYNQAKNRGAWHAITQFLSFVNETAEYVLPQNKIQRALTAAWETWRYSDEDAYLQEFVSRFNDAEFKELADVIGFDPRSITREQLAEVKVMANFVWEDSETQEMLLAFAKDYIAAQHSLEMVEGAASLVMDVAIGILISALTLGAGGALIGAAKNLRHVNLLRPLGEKLKQLAQARKLAKGKKEAITSTSSVVKERLEAPKNLSKKGGDGDTIKPGKDAPSKFNLNGFSLDAQLALRGVSDADLHAVGKLQQTHPELVDDLLKQMTYKGQKIERKGGAKFEGVPDALPRLQASIKNFKVVQERGYPFGFNSLAEFQKYKATVIESLKHYGIPTDNVRIQGSAVHSASPGDIDVIVSVGDGSFSALSKRFISASTQPKVAKLIGKEAAKGKIPSYRFATNPAQPKTIGQTLYDPNKLPNQISLIRQGSEFDIGPFLNF
ncbi:MAG: hypothetical protein P8Y67_15015, partial [Alphaproteobacteria bacterium]